MDPVAGYGLPGAAPAAPEQATRDGSGSGPMREDTTGDQDAADTDRAADDQVTALTGSVDPAVGIWRGSTAASDPDPAAEQGVDQDTDKPDPDFAFESESAEPAEQLPESEVFIEIPADRLYVVLARSAAVHIGAVLHLGITDVTDLRLAVDEACALFLLHPAFPDGAAVGLACRFAAYPGQLQVTVRAPVPPDFAPDTEGIGWIMLGALVDDLAWTRQDGYGTVTLSKRFTAPRPQ
jgi:anti-sigma regulatory factor (Ser/Thr protein kinase)